MSDVKAIADELARSIREDVGRWQIVYEGGSSTTLHSTDGLFAHVNNWEVRFGDLRECCGNEYRGTRVRGCEGRRLRRAVLDAYQRRTPALMHTVVVKNNAHAARSAQADPTKSIVTEE